MAFFSQVAQKDRSQIDVVLPGGIEKRVFRLPRGKRFEANQIFLFEKALTNVKR